MKPLREVLAEHREDMRSAEEAARSLRSAAHRAEAAAMAWQKVERWAGRAWKVFFLVAFLGGFAGGGLVLLYLWIIGRL